MAFTAETVVTAREKRRDVESFQSDYPDRTRGNAVVPRDRGARGTHKECVARDSIERRAGIDFGARRGF